MVKEVKSHPQIKHSQGKKIIWAKETLFYRTAIKQNWEDYDFFTQEHEVHVFENQLMSAL